MRLQGLPVGRQKPRRECRGWGLSRSSITSAPLPRSAINISPQPSLAVCRPNAVRPSWSHTPRPGSRPWLRQIRRLGQRYPSIFRSGRPAVGPRSRRTRNRAARGCQLCGHIWGTRKDFVCEQHRAGSSGGLRGQERLESDAGTIEYPANLDITGAANRLLKDAVLKLARD